jgi:hypothetical protein
MKLFTKLASASALMMASVLPAQADIILDSFDYTTAPFGGSSVEVELNTVIGSQGPIYSVVGAATTYNLGPNTGSSFNPSAETSSGELFAFWGGGLTGTPTTLTTTYDGSAFGGIDFEAFGSAFAIEILELDLDTNSSGFVVNVNLFDGTENATFSLPIDFVVQASDPTVLLTIPFNSFAASPTFNWNSVLTATVDYVVDNGNVDFRLDSIGIVPEPATLGVLGLGLMGLGLRRRKAAK